MWNFFQLSKWAKLIPLYKFHFMYFIFCLVKLASPRWSRLYKFQPSSSLFKFSEQWLQILMPLSCFWYSLAPNLTGIHLIWGVEGAIHMLVPSQKSLSKHILFQLTWKKKINTFFRALKPLSLWGSRSQPSLARWQKCRVSEVWAENHA